MIFILLTFVSLVSMLILYIGLKFILKREVTFKSIFIPLGVSTIIAYITSIALIFAFSKFNAERLYLVPFISIILFFIFSIVLYKTKAKLINTLMVIVVTIVSSFLYLTLKDKSDNFLVLINIPMNHFNKVDNKAQNKYILLLVNESDNEQQINIKVSEEGFAIIEPKEEIVLQPHQKKKIDIVLESDTKDVGKKPINIVVSNGSKEENRKTIFDYR